MCRHQESNAPDPSGPTSPVQHELGRGGRAPLDRRRGASAAVHLGRPQDTRAAQEHAAQQVHLPGNGPPDAEEVRGGAQLETVPDQVQEPQVRLQDSQERSCGGGRRCRRPWEVHEVLRRGGVHPAGPGAEERDGRDGKEAVRGGNGRRAGCGADGGGRGLGERDRH